MRILIFSDSHGKKENMQFVLSNYEYDKVIYLGDGIQDILQCDVPIGKLIIVKGNNDNTKKVEKEIVIELEGKKIFITHGDLYNVKYGIKKLVEKAQEIDADIILYGHTHIPMQVKIDDMVCINPGSITKGRLKQNTFAILDLDAKTNLFRCNICEIS